LKKVLVVSKGLFHPTVFCRYQLMKTLRETEDIEIESSGKLESLDGIDSKRFDAVILYFHEKKINAGTVKSLTEFVNKGGLVFCIHGALASFKKITEYTELIGSVFTGHEDIRIMNIKGVMDFSIMDEPYEFDLADDCEILLSDGELPVSWVRRQGKGNVVALAPGHTPATMKNQYIKNMIRYILNKY